MNDESRWRALIDGALGPDPAGDQPTAAELVAAEAGELTEPAQRERVAAYLEANPELQRAIRAGLDELARVEGAEAAAAAEAPCRAPALAELLDRLAGVFQGVLRLEPVPQLAAAASEPPAAPVPEDRQVLLDDPALRIVCQRLAGRVALMAYALGASGGAAVAGCWLDGQPVASDEPAPSVLRFELGSPARLAGRQLRVEVVEGQRRVELYWSLEPRGG